jgi:hypothetical protein
LDEFSFAKSGKEIARIKRFWDNSGSSRYLSKIQAPLIHAPVLSNAHRDTTFVG